MRLGMVLLLLVAAGLILGVEYLKAPQRRLVSGLGIFVAFLAVGVLLPDSFGNQKIAGRLLMPAGLLWMLLFTVFALDLREGKARRAILSGFAFFLFSAVGSEPLGAFLIERIESSYVRSDEDREAKQTFDAVFVLGGGTQLGPNGQPELGSSGDRVRLAAELWHAKRAELIVVSGQSPPPFNLGDLSAHTQQLLVALGVPSSKIHRLSEPRNTSEEIKAYSKLAKTEGWQNMGLISSAWHLPRALKHAEKVGLEVTPLPANHRSGPPDGLEAIDLIPNRSGFELIEIWAWESLGQAVGR